MVCFNNAMITVYAETTTENAEGDYIASYEPIETITGDVQPHTLTQDEIKAYVNDISITPLSIPMLCGPGAIANGIIFHL